MRRKIAPKNFAMTIIAIICNSRMLRALRCSKRRNLLVPEGVAGVVVDAELVVPVGAPLGGFSFEPVTNMNHRPAPKIASSAK